MAFLKRLKSSQIYRYLAAECLLVLITGFTVVANLVLRSDTTNGEIQDRSLFFIYLKNHPEYNEPLVDAYETVGLKLTGVQDLAKQVLAASTISKEGIGHQSPPPLPTLSGSTLLKPNPPSSSSLMPKRDIEVYEVKPGDSVAKIASAHGVSIQTVLSDNNLTDTSVIRPGQRLTILPTTGVRHTIKAGETISEIAKKYSVDEEDIFEYNEIEAEDLIIAGEEIIIPNGIKKVPPSPQRQKYLADLRKEDYKQVDVPADFQGTESDLTWPLPASRRISQYASRRHMGIDIPCRDCPIVAAGDGIVELAGWKKGYGNIAILNHGHGLKTVYAHGKEILVSAGDQVVRGQGIMISGSTGRSSGPHLHFEVRQNGDLVNPLKFVSR